MCVKSGNEIGVFLPRTVKMERARSVIGTPALLSSRERESLPITYSSRCWESKVPQLFFRAGWTNASSSSLFPGLRQTAYSSFTYSSPTFAALLSIGTSKSRRLHVLAEINPKYFAASNPDTNSIVKSVNFRWSNILPARKIDNAP